MGEMADMIVDMWLDDEYVFDRYIEMMRSSFSSREKAKENWERRIREDEKHGWWTTGKNNGREQIKFKDLTPIHMKNIYRMLEANHMYVPQYIKNFVEYGDRDFLNAVITKSDMSRFSVLLLERKTTCKTCPLKEVDWYEDDERSYGTRRYQCQFTKEDVQYQVENEMRGFRCPLKEVL